MNDLSTPPSGGRIAVEARLLFGPLDDLDEVRLAGTRCADCAEVALGRQTICPNCGGENVTAFALSDHGTLWTFTVARNRPPGNYRGPAPFEPFGIGLVELPDGIRVMAPIGGEVDQLTIGAALKLRCFIHHIDDEGREVVGFEFATPAGS